MAESPMVLQSFYKKRTLRFDILVVFIFLTTFSSAVIIAFTYSKNRKETLIFSRGTIERVSALIVERVSCMLKDAERLPEMAAGLISRHPEVSLENQELNAYFLECAKYRPDLATIGYVKEDGSSIFAFHLPQGNFLLKLATPREELWAYYDSNFKLLATKKRELSTTDSRNLPWYRDAVSAGKLVWATGKEEIQTAKPIYDTSQNLLGVAAASLQISLISDFFEKQKFGRLGRTYIVDFSGKIVLPLPQKGDEKIAFAAAHRLEKDFILEEGGEKYLLSRSSFPSEFGNQWQILTIDPFSDLFSGILKTQKQAVFISLLIVLGASFLVVFLSKWISNPVVILANEVDKIRKMELDSKVRVQSNIQEIALIDAAIASMRKALCSFFRYVPKEILIPLTENGKDVVLGGEKREITVFFSDISDLTPIAEVLPLETLNALLAEYFDGLSKIILEGNGFIDKYIGDSIMAFWGAPEELPHHADKACFTALRASSFLKEFNQKQKEKGRPELHTRIGINTGPVIVGNVGTRERMNYTAIGDIVNTAERLQWINKMFHTKIMLGEATVEKIDKKIFLVRPIDDVELKGRKGKVKIFELMAIQKSATVEQVVLAHEFTKAYQLFHEGRFLEAKELFLKIRAQTPGDFPTRIYLDRLSQQ